MKFPRQRRFDIVLRTLYLLSLCTAVARAADSPSTTISLTDQGIQIATPADGTYVLPYPSLAADEKQPPTAPSGAAMNGDTVAVDYPGGVKLAVERKGVEFTLHFSGLNAAARSFKMELPLPGKFKDGAKWQVQGEAAKPFPAQFAGEMFVINAQPKPLAITPNHGGPFTIAMPYGWQQILDARHWSGSEFRYHFTTAMPRNENNDAWFAFKLWPGGLDGEQAAATEALKAAAPKAAGPKAPAAAAAPVATAPQRSSMKLTQEGLAIEAGSMGQFTLAYPVFVGARWDDVRKPIEKKVDGNSATVTFDGGAHIDVAWQPAEGTLTLTPANVPAGVKSLRVTMLIDFSYSSGGSYKFDDKAETPFPAQKPAQPHIFQGHAQRFVLRNAEGGTMTLAVPPFSYLQLTDSREWGWKIFNWQFETPFQSGGGPLTVKVSLSAPAADAPKLVDRFGQTTRSDFPGKLKSEDELKQDVQAEASWLASLKPPATDTFGGLPGSGAKFGLQRTGFFHVEKKADRWLLVDPEGNAFFHLGVCALEPSDDYTYVAGRERIYEWLPPRGGEFATAYHPNNYWNPLAFSFYLANSIRKYGAPYDASAHTARTIQRLRKWGFNSAGAFGQGDPTARQAASFPAVAHLPLATWEGFADIPGTHGVFDPYSEKVRQRIDKLFAERLPAQADDPLIIGYFLANEPLYEEIPAAVAALDGSHPCKRRMMQMLQQKYATIDAMNKAWETSFASFDDVAARGLPVKTAAARQDVAEFTGTFLDAYFRVVTETFHKYDKHHMLIGNRFQPGTIDNERLCRLSGKYMDLVSFNYYTYGFDADLLGRVRGWMGDKPMIFSEFYFASTTDSGLTGGAKDVATQQQRGLAYRHYVEHAAALGYVVGIEWFTLIDQATTGRYFEKYNGEAANTGLISVADRPWRPMLDEMIKTNYGIYNVFLGQRPAFTFDDPRFAAKK